MVTCTHAHTHTHKLISTTISLIIPTYVMRECMDRLRGDTHCFTKYWCRWTKVLSITIQTSYCKRVPVYTTIYGCTWKKYPRWCHQVKKLHVPTHSIMYLWSDLHTNTWVEFLLSANNTMPCWLQALINMMNVWVVEYEGHFYSETKQQAMYVS